MFEIGNSLREARVRQQLEFAEVEQATKIRARYLRALEEESFDALPAQTYVKGFLRTYADYLGLDGQLYVDEYNSRFGTGEDEPREPVVPRRTSNVRRAAPARRDGAGRCSRSPRSARVIALVIAAWKFGDTGTQQIPNLAPAHDARTAAPHGQARRRQPRRSPSRSGSTCARATATRWMDVRSWSVNGGSRFTGHARARPGAALRRATRLWINFGNPGNLVDRPERQAPSASRRGGAYLVHPARHHARAA